VLEVVVLVSEWRSVHATWVVGSEDGAAPILSTAGVRQSIGPLLFTLALQTPLEEATAAVSDAHLVAVHKDVTLVGRPNRVEALYPASDSHQPARPPRSTLQVRRVLPHSNRRSYTCAKAESAP
jgi:hypothetical protein